MRTPRINTTRRHRSWIMLCGALLLLVEFLAAASIARASLDGTTPIDRAADIDWPMYDDPFLPEVTQVKVHDARLIPIWRAALGRPDVETRRRAAQEVGRAAENGMTGLAEFIPTLLSQLAAEDAHPVIILTTARSLIQLDAKEAATLFLMHNERGAASGVIRGGTVITDRQSPRTGGIEFVLLTDPALAKWRHEPAYRIWISRVTDRNATALVRSSAIDALRTARHEGALDAIKALALATDEDASLRLQAARAVAAMVEKGLEPGATPLATGSLPDRLVAATLLSRHTGDAAITILLRLAADGDAPVASIAIERLLAIDPALLSPLATRLIQSADATLRLQGARALAAAANVAAIDALAPLLDDLSPQVRQFVRERFIEYDKDAALSVPVRAHAMRLLAGASWRSIEQAAVILGRVDHEPAVARLMELLPHRRGEVRIAAIIAMRRIGITDPAVLDALAAHAGREADAWLATVKVASANTHLPLIMDAARDRELAQLLQLLGMARHQPAGKVMERFVPKMSGFWTEARAAGIWSLGMLHEDKADDRLAREFIGRLSDLDPNNPELLHVRRMAAISLGRMKAQIGKSGLELFYRNEGSSRHIGGACRWSLIRITGQELPPLATVEVSDTGWFISPLSPRK